MTVLAVNCSWLTHALAAALIVWIPWDKLWQDQLPDRLELAGRRGMILIQASFAQPETPLPVVEIPQTDVPVVVTPQSARVEERTFIETPSAEVEITLEPSETNDPMQRVVHIIAAKPQATTSEQATVDQSLPRQVPKSVAAAPTTAGFEKAPSFAGNAPPEYPELARQNGWSGTVMLRLVIDDTGKVIDVQVERTSGQEILDAAAVSAVRRWKGEPARKNGRAVATEETLPVTFRLTGR